MKNFFLTLTLLVSLPISAMTLEPHTVYLKTGTVLTKISDKSEVVLSKGIYAKVLELDPEKRDLFNVYDQKNVALYQVSALDVNEIAEAIKILPGIDAEKIYPPKSVFKVGNKFAEFDSQLSFNLETLHISNLNIIYNDQISTVITSRFEARTLYKTELPVEFGFSLNYQSAEWKNDIEDIKLSIISLGPQFKCKLYKSSDYNFYALSGAELAPVYRASSALYIDNYSALLFDLGVESEWNNRFGTMSIGGHFRHHEIELTKSDRPNLELTPKEFTLNSLGIMVGYKIEWDL